MGSTAARLGVCAPDEQSVHAMVAALARRLMAELGPVAVRGGVIERDDPAFEELRRAAPASSCWPVLERHPEAVLVVAYADAPVTH